MIKLDRDTSGVLLVLLLSGLMYSFFYWEFLFGGKFFWGTDAIIEYYPARVYFYETVVKEKRFPFWTEKLYGGFPIYADLENSYLNPINIVSILLFGPELSYRLLHFCTYLLGSLGLFLFLKMRGVGIVGYLFANLIYYFNNFMHSHQVHFGIVMSLYPIPLTLYLYERFVVSPRRKYLVSIALLLAYNFLWGHLQTFLLGTFAFFLYKHIVDIGKLSLVSSLRTSLTIVLVTMAVCLPQLVPTYILSQRSIRFPGNVSGYQGSLPPSMLALIIHPHIFTLNKQTGEFSGSNFDTSFSAVETNIYLGFIATLLCIIGMAIVESNVVKVYFLVLFMLFSVLSFAKYNPLINFGEVVFFNYFRYWLRTSSVLSLGMSLIVAHLIDKKISFEAKNIKFNIILVFFVMFYWVYIFHANNSVDKNVQGLKHVLSVIRQSSGFTIFHLSVIICVLFVFIILRTKRKRIKLIFQIILFLLMMYDYKYASKDILSWRLQKMHALGQGIELDTATNIRAIIKSPAMVGMESLYYNNWSIFGYSQLAEQYYINKLKASGIVDTKNPYRVIITEDRINKWKTLGVSLVYDGKNILYKRSPEYLDIFSEDLRGFYTRKKEGDIVAVVQNELKKNVLAYIKNYPGWEVYVNGKRVKPINYKEEEMFITFSIPEGESVIRLRFIPWDFIYSLLVSMSLLILFLFYPFYISKVYGLLNGLGLLGPPMIFRKLLYPCFLKKVAYKDKLLSFQKYLVGTLCR